MSTKAPVDHIWGQLTRFEMPLSALLLTADPDGGYTEDDVDNYYLRLRAFNRRTKRYSDVIFSKNASANAQNVVYDATAEVIKGYVLESDFTALASVAALNTVYTWNFGIVISGTAKPWEVLPAYWALADNNNTFQWTDAAVTL